MTWHAIRKSTVNGKDIDVYLRPLIDDLIKLWKPAGVKTIDVVIGKEFKMRAMLLWTINDFPTRSSLSGIFLNKKHKWRKSLAFNGQTKDRDPPRKFTRKDILTQLDRLPTREKGKHPSYEGNFNDKSKDTAKARQDLKALGIRKELWLGKHQNGKCLKPHAKQFPNSYTKQEFPRWFEPQIRQHYIDKDPSLTDELFALACGPSQTPISVNSCVVNSVRFVEHSHNEHHTTQNSGICSPGEKVREMIYDEDDFSHDLADYNDEVLANADDYDEVTIVVYSSDEED
ncbi:integrase, catalytic region, zinc finger, CCHC-type containing protein [Tanacetum coccineum]